MGLTEGLGQYLKRVKAISSGMTIADKAKITKAGAKAFQRELAEGTKRKHYSNHDDKVFGHMADSVAMKATNIDNRKDGTSIVGFDHYHAANARRLNNGTKSYPADHFIDDIRKQAADKVLKAEAEQYKKLVAKHGGG